MKNPITERLSMLENEFQSSEVFEDAQLDALKDDKTPEQKEYLQSFEDEKNAILGVEKVKVPDEVKPFTVSEEEFRSIVEKANAFDQFKGEINSKFDKLFGTTGQLQNEFKTARQQVAKPEPLTKERFAKLTEYFGDEALAEALAEDLGTLTIQGQSSQFDADAFNVELEKRLVERDERTKAQMHKDLINVMHPDWEEITTKMDANGNAELINVGNDEAGNPILRRVHTDDFSAWLKSLKPEAQEKALSADDALTLNKVLTEFKSWKGRKTDFEQKKKTILEEAVPIKGSSGRNETQSKSAYQQELEKIMAERGL